MGKTKKIGFYSPYLDILGGGERYVLTAAECLSHEYDVAIFWDEKKLFEKANERLLINLSKVRIVNNIFKKTENIFLKLSETSKYDLIFFLSDGSIPFSFASKNILHFQRPFPEFKLNIAAKIKLARYQKIISNSFFTKRYIDQEYQVKSEVIWPPVETTLMIPGQKEKIILSIGRFSPVKKQDAMIEYFQTLSPKIPDWKLVLIGGLIDSDKNYFAYLQKKIGSHQILLLPNADFATLKNYLAKASIYWHAAGYGEKEEQNPEKMEHFGIATVEAMAAGCVPIVYKGGGQREIVTHNKDGFLWRTKEELIDFTETIVRSDSQKRAIAKEAIVKSKQFSKKIFTEKIKKTVDGLLK